MKLIIDISKQDYELACKHPEILFGVYAKCIKNGKQLPKGHGDLIDRKALLRFEPKWYHLRNGDVACPKIDIDNAPTIVEGETE